MKKRIYIAGPMTGHADLNFPAFHAAAAELRALGHEAINPAEINPALDAVWADCMRADLAHLATCHGIHLLPGWENSRGASLEHHIAQALDYEITLASGALHPTALASAAATTKPAFVTVPATTLPNGVAVPSFQVGRYLCAEGVDGIATVSADAAPWVKINYAEAAKACAAAGGKLITELQWLAIAHDIAGQDINWTGGKVGAGAVFQGLHLGNVDEAQPGEFISDDANERRWHQLSNGERVFDFAGNAYSWVFDDVQGDELGLIAKPFAEDSPSITTAPFPSMKNGMGWRPRAGSDGSGNALVRGGCWDDGDYAGVFVLNLDWPGLRDDLVGFRCTK